MNISILSGTLIAMTREDEIIRGVVDILKRILDPSKIFLFGSRVKGTGNKHADFDFAVDCSRPRVDVEREISEKIEEVSGLYKVDIVYLGSVDEGFKKIVLKTGRIMYERGTQI
ncbi:MAG: nucleotidyltransferase domain-containing protein [Candidatus Omnitrophota bacterium]